MAISDVVLKNSYYQIFDASGNRQKETHESSVGHFKNTSGSTMTFLKNDYIGTYDKNFQRISERHV